MLKISFWCASIYFGTLITVQAQLTSTKEDSIELAQFYWDMSDEVFDSNLDSCYMYVEKAQKIYEAIGDWSQNITTLNSLATILTYQHKYSLSFDLQDSVLILAEENLTSGDPVLGYVYNNLSVKARIKGNYDLATFYANKAVLNIAKDNKWMLGRSYMNTGHLFNLKGDFEKASELLLLAEQMIIDTLGKSSMDLGGIYTRLASVYKNKKENEIAIDYFNRTENIYLQYIDQPKFKKRILTVKLLKAKFLLELGMNDDAIALVKYIEKDSSLLKYKQKADFIGLKAKLDYYKGDITFAKSLVEIEKANEFISMSMSNLQSDVAMAINYIFLADELFADSKTNEAISYFNIALDSLGGGNFYHEPEKVFNKIMSIEVLEKLIDLNITQNKPLVVDTLYEGILNLTRCLTQENNTASHKTFWAERNNILYEKAIKYYAKKEDYEKVFLFMENNKSNILIKEINESKALGYSNIPKDILNEEQRLKDNIFFLNSKLKTSSSFSNEVIQNIKQEKSEFEIELADLVISIEEQFPAYRKLKFDSNINSLEAAQNLLDDNTIAIEFFIGNDNIYALIISADQIYLHQYNNQKMLLDKLNLLILDLHNKKSDLTSINSDLSEILFSPLTKYFHNAIKNIVIIPDDILNHLPFEILKDVDQNYLGTKYNFQYQYSLRLMQILNARDTDSKEYDLLGYAYNSGSSNYLSERSCVDIENYNLLCSKNEVNNINSTLSNRQNLVTSFDANALMALADQTKVLHLATHACFNESDAELSQIYFNESSLSNLELQTKDISAELVVLSACESGYGNIIKGEGSMSLAKSFFHAGAKSTIVSLWSVDDCATSELMQFFYTYLNSGKSKDESLKLAKISYLENAHHSRQHPYYWAGFILIGDSSPIWVNQAGFSTILLGAFGLISIIGLIVFLKRRQ